MPPALSYEQRLDHSENVLVADLGGGTSDFTIMNLSPDKVRKEDRKDDIIAHGGVYIGGDLFDSEIMWYKVTPHLGRGVKYQSYDKEIEVPSILYRELKNWERTFMLKESKLRRSMDNYYHLSGNNPKIDNVRVLIDNNYVFSLFKGIEQSKINLSGGEETTIDFEKETIRIHEPFTPASLPRSSNGIPARSNDISLNYWKQRNTVPTISTPSLSQAVAALSFR